MENTGKNTPACEVLTAFWALVSSIIFGWGLLVIHSWLFQEVPKDWIKILAVCLIPASLYSLKTSIILWKKMRGKRMKKEKEEKDRKMLSYQH